MPKIEPFEEHAERYDEWFERHHYAYLSELRAIRDLMPTGNRALEIGVGTGRFAKPLGIKIGVEPSKRMAAIARSRGIEVIDAIAEELPFEDESFSIVLMITTICFVDDPIKAMVEAYRILVPNGYIIIGFIDSNSPIGRQYALHKDKSDFYKMARFYSTEEVIDMLENCGFRDLEFRQTLFRVLDDIGTLEAVKPGYGQGSFVVVRGKKVI